MPGAQAIIRIVPRGGARTARQIRDQLGYLGRKGEIELHRSERYQGIVLPHAQLKDMAEHWAEQTGNYCCGQSKAKSAQALTTHIIVSFPPNTDRTRAFTAGRAWVEAMFGSGENGGSYDYITAFHLDKEHPHIHVVINRRALDGPWWLKISRRHPSFNYNNMRARFAKIAEENGITLDASSRRDRGIIEPAITYAEYRRQERAKVRQDQERSVTAPSNENNVVPRVRRGR